MLKHWTTNFPYNKTVCEHDFVSLKKMEGFYNINTGVLISP